MVGPECFSGDRESFAPFITSCSSLFLLQRHTFSTVLYKVANAINHLAARAWLWWTADWDMRSPACSSFSVFATELWKVFSFEVCGTKMTGELLTLRQRNWTVEDYSIDFSNQNQSKPLEPSETYGLSGYIMGAGVKWHSFSGWIYWTDDQSWPAHQHTGVRWAVPFHASRGTAGEASQFSGPVFKDPKPMQLDCTSLSPEEKEHWPGLDYVFTVEGPDILLPGTC